MEMPIAEICFVANHAGPADHFAVFARELAQKGYKVQVFASGPGLKKIEERLSEALFVRVIPFSLESEEDTVLAIAAICSNAAVVITDVGHVFSISLQNTLASLSKRVDHLAYYDNPEAYVPGGYSSVAAKVIRCANGVLFANANLAGQPIYEIPSEEIILDPEKRIGVGYYPVAQAEKLKNRRKIEQGQMRESFFSLRGLVDRGQKILVYAGGNNEEYFHKAFPAFLQFLKEGSQREDLSDCIIFLQQHPGARVKNIDGELAKQWIEIWGQGSQMPRFLISEMSSEDAQVLADAMLYYQTSMGPQFVLAGIPTVQVGHVVYEDILVKNHLCPVATDTDGLLKAFRSLQAESNDEIVKEGLGIRLDWLDRLEHACFHPSKTK